MLVRQGFQYALRLKAQKEALLRRWAGCRRFVFNEALAYQKVELAAGRKRPGYAALCARLPELKKLHPWLAEPPAQGPAAGAEGSLRRVGLAADPCAGWMTTARAAELAGRRWICSELFAEYVAGGAPRFGRPVPTWL